MSEYSEPPPPPPRDEIERPVIEKPVVEPAQLPRGFWAGIDYVLHHPAEILESLRRDVNLWPIARRMFIIAVVMAATYGAVMGATNLLQGSQLALPWKLAQIAITAVKVPFLLLLTLLIVLPPVYVSSTFLGTRLSFRQLLTLLLASTAVMATVLASMATVAFFFSLTSSNYHFLKLLHVAFFAYAGLTGITYLQKCVNEVATARGGRRTGNAFVLMMVLYIFVGTQLAWVLRPFVSSPNEPFQVFRPRSGNFYESVAKSSLRLVEPESTSRR